MRRMNQNVYVSLVLQQISLSVDRMVLRIPTNVVYDQLHANRNKQLSWPRIMLVVRCSLLPLKHHHLTEFEAFLKVMIFSESNSIHFHPTPCIYGTPILTVTGGFLHQSLTYALINHLQSTFLYKQNSIAFLSVFIMRK